MKLCDFLKCELGFGMLVHFGLMQSHQMTEKKNQLASLRLLKATYRKCVMKTKTMDTNIHVSKWAKRIFFNLVICLRKRQRSAWEVTALHPGRNSRIAGIREIADYGY